MDALNKIRLEGRQANRDRLVEEALDQACRKRKKMTLGLCESLADLVSSNKIKPWKMLEISGQYYRRTAPSHAKILQAALINAVPEDEKDEIAYQFLVKSLENISTEQARQKVAALIDSNQEMEGSLLTTLKAALRWVRETGSESTGENICDYQMFSAMRLACTKQDFRPLLELLKSPYLLDGVRASAVRRWVDMLLILNKVPEQIPGAEQCLDTLINAGADMENKDRYGNSPLELAARFDKNHTYMVETLIRKIAVKYLLDRGANWRSLDLEGGSKVVRDIVQASSAYKAGILMDIAHEHRKEIDQGTAAVSKPKI